MAKEILQAIKECLIAGERTQITPLCYEALQQGALAYEIIMTMNEGMRVVGERYETGEYFLPDLVLGGVVMKEAVAILEPLLALQGAKSRGTIVAGSVTGDVHDIGKNIVIAMFSGTGFSVIDLGINVASETFLEAAKEHKADIIAASATLSTTLPGLREVAHLVRDCARGSIKVLVGGAATTQKFARDICADGWAPDAPQAVKAAESLMAKRSGDGII